MWSSRADSLMQRLRTSIPVRRVPFWRGQLVAVACIAAAWAVRRLIDPQVWEAPFISFFPAVLVASVWGGTRAGLSALVLSLVLASLSWLAPNGVSLVVLSWETVLAFALSGGVLVLISDLLRGTVRDLRRAEERQRLLASEMRHRVDNAIAMALAIARQTARGAGSVEEHVQQLEGRLLTLKRAQEVTSREPGAPIDLEALLREALEPFDPDRIALSGPAERVPQDLAPMLSLLVHELATNATKHGALSRAAGRVQLGWSREGAEVVLDWRERGGPAVGAPSRAGFGSRLVQGALPAGRGSTAIEYHPAGVRCRIRFARPTPEPPAPAARVRLSPRTGGV
jgi:two-component sensor histidine kinase